MATRTMLNDKTVGLDCFANRFFNCLIKYRPGPEVFKLLFTAGIPASDPGNVDNVLHGRAPASLPAPSRQHHPLECPATPTRVPQDIEPGRESISTGAKTVNRCQPQELLPAFVHLCRRCSLIMPDFDDGSRTSRHNRWQSIQLADTNATATVKTPALAPSAKLACHGIDFRPVLRLVKLRPIRAKHQGVPFS